MKRQEKDSVYIFCKRQLRGIELRSFVTFWLCFLHGRWVWKVVQSSGFFYLTAVWNSESLSSFPWVIRILTLSFGECLKYVKRTSKQYKNCLIFYNTCIKRNGIFRVTQDFFGLFQVFIIWRSWLWEVESFPPVLVFFDGPC